MHLESISSIDDADWLRLRTALWPHRSVAEHRADMAGLVVRPAQSVQFLARVPGEQAVGLAEASIRSEYVNGTRSSPVAFLEGLYVAPAARGQGVARRLVEAVAQWAAGCDCVELASDARLENTLGQAAHLGLGFKETERVVCFSMALPPRPGA
ncbi:MAG: GNAT family N-acetyltransferase [Ottowia sp.]|uniref:aminoglycoside 6'-N-acetyltransferase n=1 Tax=Ottowia sp. TaxID=1898956 RepID=UPI0039E68BA2